MRANNQIQNIQPIEKIISIFSYLTCGIVGLAWLIFGAVMKLSLRPFLKYHIYQSIFLSILYVLVSMVLGLILHILGFIPYIQYLVGLITFLFQTAVIFHLSIINIGVLSVIIYLCFGVLNNKYSYLPWVSEIVVMNVKRS